MALESVELFKQGQGSKKPGFFKKAQPISGFFGVWGFIGFFGQAGKNR